MAEAHDPKLLDGVLCLKRLAFCGEPHHDDSFKEGRDDDGMFVGLAGAWQEERSTGQRSHLPGRQPSR